MDELPFQIPLLGDERRKNWAKVVHNVDPSKASGWAYEGDFIAVGGIQDVAIGSVVLVYGEKGSRTNPVPEAGVYTTNSDGTLSQHHYVKGRAWARTLRDEVQRLLDDIADRPIEQLEWGPQLGRYSDDALLHELERRGIDRPR
jgi:hypothetical protein